MTKILKQTTSGGISFLELLLDETLCSGSILIEKELAIAAGGINPYLNAKQKYDLLLRIAAMVILSFFRKRKNLLSLILLWRTMFPMKTAGRPTVIWLENTAQSFSKTIYLTLYCSLF